MRLIDADDLLWCYKKRMDFERHRNHAYLKGVRDCIKDLEYQPTEEPEQKKGKWIDQGRVFECSVCHERSCCAGNYCPDCGADMRGEE